MLQHLRQKKKIAEAGMLLDYTGGRPGSNLSRNTILKVAAYGFPYYLQVNAR